MKKLITLLVCAIALTNVSKAQIDSIYYYNPDGTENWWYIQKDVRTFRFDQGNPYSQPNGNTSVIESIEHSPYSQRQQVVVKFTPTSTTSQRDNAITNIHSSDIVEYQALTVTKDYNSKNDYSVDKYVLTNDVIMVNFIDDNLSQQDISAFMNRHELALYHEPSSSLPSANWTYGFRLTTPIYDNTFEACKTIFNLEDTLISRCIPDMKILKPSACQPVSELDDLVGTNTPDAIWHIRNQGNVIGSGLSGINDADADICECWGEGYHGSGVKIAVIDFGGFDYTHPDLQGQFLAGWNLIDNTSHTSSFWNNANPEGHGMATCGVIASKANAGGQFSSVGIAYDSKIIPLLTNGGGLQLIAGIQKAVSMEADIINMSLGYDDNSIGQSFLYSELENARNVGRNGLGIISIASTGNDDLDIRHFPASDTTVVFGVGATDPNDFRGSYTNQIPWSWNSSTVVKGSNYLTPASLDGDNERYNVVAPGTRIYTAWTENPITSPNQRNGAWTGTSFATPITAGIAALILNKNQGLFAQEVDDAIQNNSEQIKSSTYNYNNYSFIPNYNNQVFFGRVNCLSSLNNVAVGVKEYQESNLNIKLAYLNKDEIGVLFDVSSNKENVDISVYDISGKLISLKRIDSNKYNYILNISEFTQGIYILNISDELKNSNQSFKFVK
jgi:subtilisin family serine protease